jgi:NADH-quinone oxidoreductase subunit J
MSGIIIGIFGALAVICALLVLALRQPMRAALALIALMINLAAIYACLGAHVVAVFQILIYVGAVMVFMVYTIMLLDERDTSYQQPFNGLGLAAVVVALVCIGAFVKLFAGISGEAVASVTGDIFTFANFSQVFMAKYWFHFELATVLLLVGILAAWAAIKEGRHG